MKIMRFSHEDLNKTHPFICTLFNSPHVPSYPTTLISCPSSSRESIKFIKANIQSTTAKCGSDSIKISK